MKPFIGLSGVLEPQSGIQRVHSRYMSCILENGGLPVLLPTLASNVQVQELAKNLDGIVLTGGGDITPEYYGQTLQTKQDHTEPIRDAFELSLTKAMSAARKPILGICRGMQLIAVAYGVPLKQEIEGHEDGISHEVDIYDSMLREICGVTHAKTNSFHRQAVCEPPTGSCVRVCARAADGVIEAIACEVDSFCLGVQWHPERMDHSAAGSDRIFSSFVSACCRFK